MTGLKKVNTYWNEWYNFSVGHTIGTNNLFQLNRPLKSAMEIDHLLLQLHDIDARLDRLLRSISPAASRSDIAAHPVALPPNSFSSEARSDQPTSNDEILEERIPTEKNSIGDVTSTVDTVDSPAVAAANVLPDWPIPDAPAASQFVSDSRPDTPAPEPTQADPAPQYIPPQPNALSGQQPAWLDASADLTGLLDIQSDNMHIEPSVNASVSHLADDVPSMPPDSIESQGHATLSYISPPLNRSTALSALSSTGQPDHPSVESLTATEAPIAQTDNRLSARMRIHQRRRKTHGNPNTIHYGHRKLNTTYTILR